MQGRLQHYWNRDMKKIQAVSKIQTHDLCDAGAVLSNWAIRATLNCY